MIYLVFTKKQMYSIEASYFIASDTGVMFFNENDEGVGFIPAIAIELIKIQQ